MRPGAIYVSILLGGTAKSAAVPPSDTSYRDVLSNGGHQERAEGLDIFLASPNYPQRTTKRTKSSCSISSSASFTTHRTASHTIPIVNVRSKKGVTTDRDNCMGKICPEKWPTHLETVVAAELATGPTIPSTSQSSTTTSIQSPAVIAAEAHRIASTLSSQHSSSATREPKVPVHLSATAAAEEPKVPTTTASQSSPSSAQGPSTINKKPTHLATTAAAETPTAPSLPSTSFDIQPAFKGVAGTLSKSSDPVKHTTGDTVDRSKTTEQVPASSTSIPGSSPKQITIVDNPATRSQFRIPVSPNPTTTSAQSVVSQPRQTVPKSIDKVPTQLSTVVTVEEPANEPTPDPSVVELGNVSIADVPNGPGNRGSALPLTTALSEVLPASRTGSPTFSFDPTTQGVIQPSATGAAMQAVPIMVSDSQIAVNSAAPSATTVVIKSPTGRTTAVLPPGKSGGQPRMSQATSQASGPTTVGLGDWIASMIGLSKGAPGGTLPGPAGGVNPSSLNPTTLEESYLISLISSVLATAEPNLYQGINPTGTSRAGVSTITQSTWYQLTREQRPRLGR